MMDRCASSSSRRCTQARTIRTSASSSRISSGRSPRARSRVRGGAARHARLFRDARKVARGFDPDVAYAHFLVPAGLAAALAHHNSKHDNRDDDHDHEYSRGYQDALYGATYDRNDSEGYHDGYLAGEAERSNRRAANTPRVRSAPWAAQQACSARADDYQNQPRGSSTPISLRDAGNGDWQMVMGTGSYRSVCVASSDGRVRSIDPY